MAMTEEETKHLAKLAEELKIELDKRGWQERVRIKYDAGNDKYYSREAQKARKLHPDQTGIICEAFKYENHPIRFRVLFSDKSFAWYEDGELVQYPALTMQCKCGNPFFTLADFGANYSPISQKDYESTNVGYGLRAHVYVFICESCGWESPMLLTMTKGDENLLAPGTGPKAQGVKSSTRRQGVLANGASPPKPFKEYDNPELRWDQVLRRERGD